MYTKLQILFYHLQINFLKKNTSSKSYKLLKNLQQNYKLLKKNLRKCPLSNRLKYTHFMIWVVSNFFFQKRKLKHTHVTIHAYNTNILEKYQIVSLYIYIYIYTQKSWVKSWPFQKT